MNNEQRAKIQKIQSDLIRINNKERFFFNITVYMNLGLIYDKDVYGTDATGNKVRVRTDYFLTEKAKQYIKVNV